MRSPPTKPPDGQDHVGSSALLIRRHRHARTLSYYRCCAPSPVPLSRLIPVAQTRWRIEEDHQLSNQVAGMDSGQVTRWRSWHHWSAVCLLACIYLAVATAADQTASPSPELIPLSVPELLQLLRGPSNPVALPRPGAPP